MHNTEPKEIYSCLPAYFEKGDIIGVRKLIGTMSFRPDEYYFKLVIIRILISIFETEVSFDSEITVFDDYTNIESLLDNFIQLKLLVHRLEFDLAPETHKEVYYYCKNNHISFYYLNYLISHNTVYTKETYNRFAELYFEHEGSTSLFGNLFSGIE